ncbi:MAG: DMT family transporter [Bacteroidales bacterium]|jgi:drug/metabolite transporter (DMT)-like permease|nr:DMT family transporter [Bacteroidales bacterium]
MEQKLRPEVYIYIAAVTAMLFWGMSFIWTSIVFESYSPITTIFLRLLLSSVFLFLFMAITGRFQKIRREHTLLILVSALFNPFFYFIGENYGLKYSTATISAVIIATIPLVTPVAAWLMIKEKVSWVNIAGILISFSGILLMVFKPDLSLATEPRGILMLFFAVFSAVIYSILLRRLTKYYRAVSIVAWQNLIGTGMFLPLFLIMDLSDFLEVVPSGRLITALLSLAILASSIAFILFTISIKHLGVSRANVYGNLIPVFTAVASYYVLQESFTSRKISGIILVITGVIITQIKRKYQYEKEKNRSTW